MKTYNIVDNVNFLIFNKPVGACVSGGADSALMLYFLLKYAENTVHVFSFASQQKKLINPKASIDVIAKCAELTNNYNFQQHIVYQEMQTRENLFLLPKQYMDLGITEYTYTGITKNPPKLVTDSFKNPDTENDVRSPSVIRDSFEGKYYRPWTNIDKQQLAAIYKEYNLMETLFPLTRSCEYINQEIPLHINPKQQHCENCWWCEERFWGFGKYV